MVAQKLSDIIEAVSKNLDTRMWKRDPLSFGHHSAEVDGMHACLAARVLYLNPSAWSWLYTKSGQRLCSGYCPSRL